MQSQLHGYQKRAIKFALENRQSFMAIDMGLGKTAIALKFISQIQKTTLVIAPLRVVQNTWPEEIKKWTPHLSYTVLHGKDKLKRLTTRRNIYLINYEGLKWLYNTLQGAKRINKFAVVVDESTYIKSSSAKRFKILKAMLPLFSQYRMCLSAKPAPNGLHDLWSQYFILDHGRRLGEFYTRFRNAYFVYSGPPVFQTRLKSNFHGRELIKQVKDITFRLDTKDHLELPKLMYNTIKVNIPEKLKDQYNELEKDFAITLGGDTIEVLSEMAMGHKLRQFVQGAIYYFDGYDGSRKVRKVKYIHDLKARVLKEIMESSPGKSILCPIQFRFEIEIIQNFFGKTFPIIAGGTTADEASQNIKAWNEGRTPLLLCHPAAMSHGLNLQYGGNLIVWFGLTWNLDHYHQLNGRIHRQGQKNTVVVHNILIKNSIDEAVMRVLKRKNSTQRDLLNELRRRYS